MDPANTSFITKSERLQESEKSLSLFEHSNKIMRCRGRTEASTLPYDNKFATLLPIDHRITRLIVMQCHEDVIHNGELRSRFWIIPAAPALPDFRLSNDFAFTRVGVDNVGPLYVKDIYSPPKVMHKSCIALYTCASSRAIHLGFDLVPITRHSHSLKASNALLEEKERRHS